MNTHFYWLEIVGFMKQLAVSCSQNELSLTAKGRRK
jgi:hypothetical protein